MDDDIGRLEPLTEAQLVSIEQKSVCSSLTLPIRIRRWYGRMAAERCLKLQRNQGAIGIFSVVTQLSWGGGGGRDGERVSRRETMSMHWRHALSVMFNNR